MTALLDKWVSRASWGAAKPAKSAKPACNPCGASASGFAGPCETLRNEQGENTDAAISQPFSSGLRNEGVRQGNAFSEDFAVSQISQGCRDEQDARDDFEERAARLEFDGGLSRADAERQAHAEVYGSGAAVWTLDPTRRSARPLTDAEVDAMLRDRRTRLSG